MKKLTDLPLGLYEKAICFSLPWEEKLLLTKQAGFDFLEVNIDGEEPRVNRLYDKNCVTDLNRAIQNTGVRALSLALTANRKYPLGGESEAVRQKGVDAVKRAVDFALATGARIIQLAAYCGGPDQPAAQAESHLYGSLEKCVEYAAMHCVTITFENIDTQLIKNIKQIMRYVRMIDSPFFQAYADIGNMNAMGADAVANLAEGGRHIVGVHVKDSKPSVVRDVPYGEGTVDFGRCFRMLSDMEYGGVLVAEMWCHEDAAFHAYLATANSFIRKAMAEAIRGSNKSNQSN